MAGNESSTQGGVVVVGAGPMIGTAVARRFARQGRPVTMIARSPETMEIAVKTVVDDVDGGSVRGLTADVTDDAAIAEALDDAAAAHGVPEVVVYNAALIRADRVGDLSASQLAETLAVNALGALTVAARLAPRMVDRGHGSLLFTGGMPWVKSEYLSLSLGKAALRTVADLLAAEYGARGLHVATVTVCDVVAPGTAYDPDLIAAEFEALHAEPPGHWRREVVFQR
jgi:NAD(P)-dependent dehydrogenase (short-subunit alcohol dehydrogenase family)